jgi:hypothetical protein
MVLALRDHFHAPEYVLLPQCRNAVGFDATRTADALVMSVWPSRGLHLYGVEIKVSRSDWQRELKDPKKADTIGQFCDFWFLAAGDESIVKDGELPPGWGLLVPGKKPGTLRVKTAPVRIESVAPISRTFLAAILRKTFEASMPLKEVEDEINRRVLAQSAELRQQITDQVTRSLDRDYLIKRNAELEAVVKAFEEASGVWIGSSADSAKRYGKALKALGWGGIDGLFERAEKTLAEQLKTLRGIRKELPVNGSDSGVAS